MIGIIFGAIFGMICFVLGCILTWQVCKHYEQIAVEAKVKKTEPVGRWNPGNVLDPMMPQRRPQPQVDYEEDDEDGDEV
jgi:hypothetical protein